MLNSLRSFVHMLRLPKPDYEVYCREKRLELESREFSIYEVTPIKLIA